MKFHYAYRDSNNERHDDFVEASSKDDAFKKVRAAGRKPFFIELAPGFLNRVRSLGKRGLAIVALAVLSLVLGGVAWVFRGEVAATRLDALSPLPRHQIYGDPAILDEYARTDFATVLAHPGDRILARYAQPGLAISAEDARWDKVKDEASARDLVDCLAHDCAINPEDSSEAAELKRIVNGMKDELRVYLADPLGTPARYLRRLRERLTEEMAIRNRIETELGDEPTPDAVRTANASLRALGIRPIVADKTGKNFFQKALDER